MIPRVPQGQPVKELTLEQQILAELGVLNQKVTDLASDGRSFRTELLGGVGADTKHGRLPRVENLLEQVDKRTEKLENDAIRWKAYAAAAAFIGGTVGAIVAFVVEAGIRLLGKH